MIERDHLQAYELTLTTQGFVCGQRKTAAQGIRLQQQKADRGVSQRAGFFDLLIQNNLVELFEGYCMRQGGDLYTFLYKECGLNAAQVKPAILYEVDASNAMDAEHTLKDIDCFMRDAKQRAYIPGSSAKAQFERRCFSMRFKRADAPRPDRRQKGHPKQIIFIR